jgi:hypothetical protein
MYHQPNNKSPNEKLNLTNHMILGHEKCSSSIVSGLFQKEKDNRKGTANISLQIPKQVFYQLFCLDGILKI